MARVWPGVARGVRLAPCHRGSRSDHGRCHHHCCRPDRHPVPEGAEQGRAEARLGSRWMDVPPSRADIRLAVVAVSRADIRLALPVVSGWEAAARPVNPIPAGRAELHPPGRAAGSEAATAFQPAPGRRRGRARRRPTPPGLASAATVSRLWAEGEDVAGGAGADAGEHVAKASEGAELAQPQLQKMRSGRARPR